jgi:biopolymer transport protein ExbB/TolQ
MSLEILADAGKWLTTGVLFLFSIMNIAIIVERVFFYRNENKSSAAAKADECIRMLKEKAYGDAVKACTGISNGMIHLIMVTATFLLGDDSPAADTSILELELENSLSLERMRSEKYVSILGSTGAVSPLIGLFGTVLGIMKSFAGISSGSAHGAGMLQTVSAGIWEALYTTAFGILVAVPALMLYNYFANKANTRLELLENMANNMLIIARKNRS